MDIHHPTAVEREAALDLIGEAFGNPRARRPAVREAVLSDPDYGPETTLVATEQGELVGHLATKRSAIALHGWWLPVARLGSVCSAPTHRRRGVGAALVQAACNLYPDVAAVVLNPASDDYVRVFYESLGFRSARRTIGCQRVTARDVPPAPPLLVRAAREGEAARLDALYAAHYGALTGAKQRTPAWWERRIAGRPLLWAAMTPRVLVAESAEGLAVAYAVVTDDDDQRVWELAGSPDGAAALLWHEAGRQGAEFTVAMDAGDPLWPVVQPTAPVDISPEPGIVMMRASSVPLLTGVLSQVLAARGARLETDGSTALVCVGTATLRCDWTELLCLSYDGVILPERLAEGAVRIERGQPDDWARIFPARAATRRMTDAF